jgi:DNA-binding beta-propeller fold protein YncE
MIRKTTPLAILLLGLLPAAAMASELPDFAKGIRAGQIVAISDGDFVGQTYADGRLAPADAGFADLLSVIALDGRGRSSASVRVSNSVTAAPEILAVTEDGRTAFVTERLGERPSTGETTRDLPPGRRLFALDLSDKAKPILVATQEIPAFPEALALSPDGRTVATVSNTPEASFVTLSGYGDRRFGPARSFDLAKLGVTGTAKGPRGGVTATNVQWHPQGRILAVTINTQDRVAFLALDEAGALRPWGEPVTVGRDPFVGRFSPDGRFYLTSNWGRDFAATSLDGRLPSTPSTISVVRLGGASSSQMPAAHERLLDVATGNSAEGLAISPDGSLVATVNMHTTAFPPSSPRFVRNGSVTLLRFDGASGALTKIADYPFEGVLPEGGTFDLAGEHFLATVFHGHAGASPDAGPGLETFRVVKGEAPRLERLGRIPMPHGVHHVVVTR